MRWIHLLVPALVVVCSSCHVLDYTRGEGSGHAVAQSVVNLTQSIYKIYAKKEGNIIFSPMGVSTILALKYMGARGCKAQQMAAGLYLPDDNTVVKNGFHAFLTSLKSDGNVKPVIANKLFVERTYSLKEEYAKMAQESFLADVESVDFRTQAEATRELINKWVGGKSEDKIKDLLAIDFPKDLVLANTVYFKRKWAIKFDLKDTKMDQFFVTSTQTKEAVTMYFNDFIRLDYNEELKCRVLELPYVGGKFNMVVLLPTEVDGLAALEAKLPYVDLSKLLTDLRQRTYAHVSLPMFSMNQMELKNITPVMKELGLVGRIDDQDADFSGIADGETGVTLIHKSSFSYSEESSEATAGADSVVSEPATINCNHPFTFAVVDSTTKTPVFFGRFSQPE